MAICSGTAYSAKAKCVLPVPDGGDEKPSPANIHGTIFSVEGMKVVVTRKDSGKRVTVLLPPNPEIYSAFGGDVSISDLAKGQTVWVWLRGCKLPTSGDAVSAYFQIFSRDPKDKP